MKELLLISGLLLISWPACSQERDTFQPDSVYRINNVKTIIRSNEKAKARLIYNYDRQGRWIEFILTDNFVENKIQMKVDYKYDDAGNLIAETTTSYGGKKELIKDSKIEHDEEGRVSSIKKYIGEQLISEETFFYDPLVKQKKEYRNGVAYKEAASYYEYPNYTNRYVGIELGDKDAKTIKTKTPDGKREVPGPAKEDRRWDYTFENTLDDQGRILKRRRFSKGELQDESTYEYNEKGLLIKKSENRIAFKFETKELFKYEYWD